MSAFAVIGCGLFAQNGVGRFYSFVTVARFAKEEII